MVSPKENYMMALRGDQPEWVPQYSFGPSMGTGPWPNYNMGLPILQGSVGEDGIRRSLYGVRYVTTDSAGGAGMPANDEFILSLDDLPNWGDIIKIPDFSGTDWEAMVTDVIKKSGINREESSLSMSTNAGYFQLLVSFMGFEQGLIALYECPDSVKEMLDALSDFYADITAKTIDYFKPDILHLSDDTAAWHNPFISAEFYREFFYPNHDKYAKFGRDRGILMEMHNCGKCESVIPIFLDMGLNGWSAAQSCNDLTDIKATYGNTMTIMGGWDPTPRLLEPFASPDNPNGLTEEEIRQSVRDVIDMLAPGGGYVWCSGFLAAVNDDMNVEKNRILQDEAIEYGKIFYQK